MGDGRQNPPLSGRLLAAPKAHQEASHPTPALFLARYLYASALPWRFGGFEREKGKEQGDGHPAQAGRVQVGDPHDRVIAPSIRAPSHFPASVTAVLFPFPCNAIALDGVETLRHEAQKSPQTSEERRRWKYLPMKDPGPLPSSGGRGIVRGAPGQGRCVRDLVASRR